MESELETLKLELETLEAKLVTIRADFDSGRWKDTSAEYRRIILDQEHYMAECVRCLNRRISILNQYVPKC